MKKLLIGMVAIFSVSTFAGDIVSESGSLLRLQFDQEARTVDLLLRSGSRSTTKKFTIQQFEELNQAGARYVRTEGYLYEQGSSINRQHLFRNSEEMFKEARVNFNHVWAGYLIPVYNFYLLRANLEDIVSLPVNMTWKALRNKWAKKDLKVLNHAINTDAIQEISDQEFHRLFFYL